MKHEKLSNALDEISDAHIAESSAVKKRKPLPWLGAVAAVLAVAILVGTVGRPTTASGLVASPTYPQMVQYSEANYDAWRKNQKSQYNQPEGYADGMEDFLRSSMQQFLTSNSENQVYSPLNTYIALAMLTESTGGDSRQQLLTLLGSDSIEALRTQTGHVWNAHYSDDGLSTSILANSLWLNSAYDYNADTAGTLANSYYASVYQGDLGSSEMNKALRAWLNDQTGGLLEEQAENVKLYPESALALASTLYYQAHWSSPFYEQGNVDGTFHTPSADVGVTFMRKELSNGPYYWGEDFGAVQLYLEDGSRMWLVLPDEDYTPADILESGHALDMVFCREEYENQKRMVVHLSVPKFDVTSNADLVEGLKQLGITDIFQSNTADLSALLPEAGGSYVNQISHAARVAIDEKGVTATAYTLIEAPGAAPPPEEEIDFILDRPFLFIIESRDGIPLFAGIVNDP